MEFWNIDLKHIKVDWQVCTSDILATEKLAKVCYASFQKERNFCPMRNYENRKYYTVHKNTFH